MDSKNETISISVGSVNPVKIQTTKNGFSSVFNDKLLNIHGYSVESGVKDQPFGIEETLLGAKNRAISAFIEFQTEFGDKPNYSIGIEGGISTDANDTLLKRGQILECFAWIVIYDGVNFGMSKTATLTLPKIISNYICDGVELGDADDIVFRSINSKQKSGVVGHLTKNLIDRTAYYDQSVILAFAPFMWANMYFNDESIENQDKK